MFADVAPLFAFAFEVEVFECCDDSYGLSCVLVSEFLSEDVGVGFFADFGDVDAAESGCVFVADGEAECVWCLLHSVARLTE